MKKVTNKELLQKIGTLEERVQELENTSDVQTANVSLIKELIEIFKELPMGRSLINRAINRSKLRYLKQIVLPRRYQQLEKLKLDKSMPEGIQKMLITNTSILCLKAEKDTRHRLYFEHKSASKVRSIFMKLQKMLTNRRIQIPHIKEGESHANN